MINKELYSYYRDLWPRLDTLLPHDKNLSNPLLIHAPEAYISAELKLVVVGQETHGWGVWGNQTGANPVKDLQDYYRDFNLGERYKKTPFIRAMHGLQSRLDGLVRPFGFVWANLFTCSQNRGRLDNNLATRMAELKVLSNELRILRPDAVVFFTGFGRMYDSALRVMFPNFKTLSNSGGLKWVQVLDDGDFLPKRCFRTYHPAYLSRRGEFDNTLDYLNAQIRAQP